MAETLGMLCDKLTIVKLKQYHTEDPGKLEILSRQADQLQQEINEYVADAVSGRIPPERLTFDANKVFKQGALKIDEAIGSIGAIVSQLADVNCKLWHEQEKVYEFEKVPAAEKDKVVGQLAVLNLERNNCIDAINKTLKMLVS